MMSAIDRSTSELLLDEQSEFIMRCQIFICHFLGRSTFTLPYLSVIFEFLTCINTKSYRVSDVPSARQLNLCETKSQKLIQYENQSLSLLWLWAAK